MWYASTQTIHDFKVCNFMLKKVKISLLQAVEAPRVPRGRGSHIYLDKRLADGGKVNSSTRRLPFTPRFLFLRFLLLISVRGWVDARAIVRPEGLGKLKKSASSERDPATFRFVA
jgi:hypothetical protein